LKKHLTGILLLALFLSACKKDKITLLIHEVASHTTHQLHDVVFVNDSVGYICGGEKWEIGIFLRTTDGGNTWSMPDSIFNACAYSMHFFSASEGLVVGNVSNWASTSDSGKMFSSSQSDYRPIDRVAFLTRDIAIKVGGDNYADGYISYTNNAGNTWFKTELPNHMTDVQITDSNTLFACGYGVVYKSTNAGYSFHPLDTRGDFFMALDFPTRTTGYFAGYEGMIIKTSDGGNSFKTIRKGNQAFGHRVHFEDIKFWDENTGYAIGDAGLLLKTENGGEDWKTAEEFTDVNLRGIYLFSATSGIVVGDNGKIFKFQ
jgi:photosystem II stability/assembly factor-like uncharacterized protein